MIQIKSKAIKPRSLATRIFFIVLGSNVAILLTVLVASFFALEDLEITFLESTKNSEISYLEKYIDKTKPLKIQTNQVTSIFRPKFLEHDMDLPILFQNVPIPFEGEVETISGEYLVFTYIVDEGVYFYAKNLEHFEKQESLALLFMQWLAISLIFLSFLLAFIASRLIARPVEKLSNAIKSINPNNLEQGVSEEFSDKELIAISALLNKSLLLIERSIKREKSLIALASHELRTPISVMLGAANVIERRQQLLPNDVITMQRIVDAAKDMSNTVEALLNLVRQVKAPENQQLINLDRMLHKIIEEYSFQKDRFSQRISITKHHSQVNIVADPVLLKLLIQNILNNSLDHAIGNITIELFNDHIAFNDSGIASDRHSQSTASSTGLGLFIVNMICEHLQWQFEINSLAGQGTEVLVYFNSQKPLPV